MAQASFSLQQGMDVIRDVLKFLPNDPGVYRMIDVREAPLYIGKARHLRKRVRSYLQVHRLPVRLQRMIARTATVHFTVTQSEMEALFLEASLIKRFQPQYNILLRDDKSFPSVALTKEHTFPGIVKVRHRQQQYQKGMDVYGPFASVSAVERTMTVLQKVFLLRNCTDSYFACRKRPCLQYQIKQCTAPCVGRVSMEDYGRQVKQAELFLLGKGEGIREELVDLMLCASRERDFEAAARYRDRLRVLTEIQAQQYFITLGDSDVIAAVQEQERTCIQVQFFRHGYPCGDCAYFLSHGVGAVVEDVLSAFLGQFYENKPLPSRILLSHTPTERKLLSEGFSLRKGERVVLRVVKRGKERTVLEHALRNAQQSLARHLAERTTHGQILRNIGRLFGLSRVPKRIEVFDNSHHQGSYGVGAMVVMGEEGFVKGSYRRFHIRSTTVGDDYGMMREVMRRRFKDRSIEYPDLVLVDGGLGHLRVVEEVLVEEGVSGVEVVAMSKGRTRRVGQEQFFHRDRPPLRLSTDDPTFYALQRLRDEVHRFAVGSYRKRHKKGLCRSVLDEIIGIGVSRKRALLHYFGSTREISRVGVSDLREVKGISLAMARRIYEYFQK